MTRAGYGFLGIGYLIWGWKNPKFTHTEAIRRWLRYEVGPALGGRPFRRAWKLWRAKDRRPKSSYAHMRTIVNRDGDFFLMECPLCHSVDIRKDKEAGVFRCPWHAFRAYPEDGVLDVRDFRNGPIVKWPMKAVQDPSSGKWYLGISADAPWWWRRREVCRDLQINGKDAHGHRAYEVVALEPPQYPSGLQQERLPDGGRS